MANSMDLREDDRLPWLETVEPEEQDGPSLGRVIAAVVLGLGVLAAIIFGIYKLQQRPSGGGGDGQIIAAQPGSYKVKPEEPGGLKVDGEGDAAIATSAGKAGNGAIDLKAVPERPVEARRIAPTPTPTPQAGRNAVAQVPKSGGKLVAATPVSVARPAAAAVAGGSLVQLGAFPSEAAAKSAWTSFSKRFAYLAPLGQSIQPVATGGKTLYRLRVNAGSANQAADLCGRLRVAGESCFIAS
ncbi:MAG TPA: SPOR domain-containing protein [Sphingomonas sp.]|jgi:hypothetical protein|nr:SPOR domain-containing protein [Sphingomonas sp.]